VDPKALDPSQKIGAVHHPPAPVSLFSAGQNQLRAAVVVAWARALLGAGAVLVVGRIIDRVASGQPTSGLLLLLGGLLATRALLAGLAPLTAVSTATKVELDLRHRLLDAVLSTGPWSGRRTGDLVGKATEGVDAVGALAGTFLPQLIGGMSIPLLLAAVVATIDVPTAAVLVLVLPLIPFLLRLLEGRFASVSARYRETADLLAARFLDGIQGLRTLQALDRAEAYGDEIAQDAERLRIETMGLLRVNQLALLAVDSLFTLATVVAAAGMAGWRLAAGALTVGEAVSLVLLGVMLIEPLSSIGRFFYVGAIGRAAAAQMRELFSLVPRPVALSEPGDGAETGVVEFSDVSFTYPDGTPALADVTFRVAAGERVALVGPSGAGKSTIALLTLGLANPDHGAVRVGGRAVLVAQRPFLFHGSIRDNLVLARPGVSDEEVWEALEAADLTELFAQRREGLDVPVGDRGLRLSGGEVQRLAIARALLVDAPVVVLDEPTSNVDLDSEARIRVALDRLTRGRTVVIIAHRRSTIAGVDRVLRIEQGRMSGAGVTPEGVDVDMSFEVSEGDHP
jgi:ATP-binding cassette subfamily C protein CydD